MLEETCGHSRYGCTWERCNDATLATHRGLEVGQGVSEKQWLEVRREFMHPEWEPLVVFGVAIMMCAGIGIDIGVIQIEVTVEHGG